MNYSTGKSSTTTILAGLTRSNFNQLPRGIVKAIEKQLVQEILLSHELLQHLTPRDKKIVEQNVEFKTFQDKEYIIEENKPVDNLLIGKLKPITS